jgi:hypothetical protein
VKEEDVAQLVRSLTDNAQRLGLVWTRRYGTVITVTSRTAVTVQMDGDDSPTPIDCVSLVGRLIAGARVAVDSVPPSAKFVVGILAMSNAGYKLVSKTSVIASGTVTLSTSAQDVPGVAVTVSVNAGALYTVDGVFDMEIQVTGNATMAGLLDIDTVGQTAQAILDDAGVTPRATVAQNWDGSLTAGSHTFKLRALKSAAVGTMRVNTHTTMRVCIWEPL